MATTDVGAVHGSRVVWTAFVVAVFGWGVGFYGPGIYLVALHRSHGWPIATISLAITAHFLAGALLIGVTAHTVVGYILAFIAAFFAAANVVGGYAVTGRMLKMFRRKAAPAPAPAPAQEAASAERQESVRS